MVPPPQPELIWMADDRTVPTPLELLTHLLAGAIAQDLPQAAVSIVTLSQAGGLRVDDWDGVAGRFVRRLPLPLALPPPPPITAADLRNLIPAIPFGAGLVRLGRVFVVHLDDPLHLPPPADPAFGFDATIKFDRAVLVTDETPVQIPGELIALLDPALFTPAGIGFSGVVPSVLATPSPPGFPWAEWLGLAGMNFGAREEPEDEQMLLPGPVGEAVRLFRDSCGLTLDLPSLSALWGPWNAAGRLTAFLDEVDAAVKARARRWGRAVTNRRVGVAVSGGGACAYRLSGLLRRLEEADVPVDVVAGLSGGALIGAYYCARGAEGLAQVASRGPIFGVTLPLAILSSCFIEKAIDFDLACAHVEDTDVRYVAVAAELPGGSRPRSSLVSKGTVGEAVRASGTLPPAIGPTKKGGARYMDGGAASLVPAEIVRNCGADLTVAYNVIPGPNRSNPLDILPFGLGGVLHDLPIIGRVIDVWVWYSFLWSRASRRFGQAADVSIAFDDDVPMLETIAWMFSASIAQAGYDDPEVIARVDDVHDKWVDLQQP